MNNLLAGAGSVDTSGTITNPALGEQLNTMLYGGEVGYISKLITATIGLLFIAGSVAFFFMLLLGGVQWISSGGDKASLEGARGKITNAIIGLVLLLASFAIVKLIETFFGIDILTIDIGALVIQ